MTTPTTVNVRLQLRADTAANWTAANPTLLANEVGLETDTKKLKVGNGSSAWNSLAYFPSIVSGGTVLGNLEIGSTGTLTFEGSTADGFETTLAVTNPTADRTITLPNQSGTVVVSGNASIVDADIAANAEIAVSKLADGSARQLLQTDAAGTGVEWTSNVDIPGTLDVTGAATFDGAVTVAGDLTVNGTTTNINTQNLVVEDKNIILGDVATPTDVTADGGGITLKGATDKTINWYDATDAWTSSERFSVPLGSAASPSLTFTGDENTGIYSPGADQVAISTGGSGRLFVDASGNVGVSTSSPGTRLHVNDGFIRTGRYGAAGVVQLDRAQGTAASPTAISSSAGIGAIQARGFDGSNYQVGGALFFITDGAVSSTSSPAAFTVETTSSGSTTSQERLRITSAGLVGVGTSSPGSIFHCNYATATDTYIRTTNSAGTNGFDFGVSSGGEAWVFNRNNSNMYLGTNSAQRVTITAGGNVGIGTTSPAARLDVAGYTKIGNYTGTFQGLSLQNNNDSSSAETVSFLDSLNNLGTIDSNIFFGHQTDGASYIALGTTPAGSRSSDRRVERVRITGSGNVGIGATSPAYKLHVVDSVNEGVILQVLNNYSGAGTGNNAIVSCANTNNYFNMQLLGQQNFALLATNSQYTLYRSPLHIFQNSAGTTEYGRFDGSGRLLVGTSSAPSVVAGYGSGDIQLVNQASVACIANVSTVNSAFGAQILLAKSRGGTSTVVQNGDIYGQIRWAGADGTDIDSTAASIEAVVDGTPGANDMPGRLVFSTTKDGQASPTEALRIDSQQRVGIGKTPDNSSSNGVEFWSSGVEILARSSGTCLYVNRNTSDGTIVEIQQDAVQEGSISVSGTTVSYNGAHLSRWSQLPSGAERTEILRGSVLSNIDEMCEWGDEDNEQLNRMKVSDVEGDKNVSGVFQAWDDDDDTYTDDFYCAMTGDFIIRIAEGVTVQRGDLLMSAGDGTAKPQDDDIIRSKTIAKVTSTNVSCTYEDGSYCVPCVLMAC